MTSGQITYDLRRLRLHGLIDRIPRTFRYQVTDTGMRTARSSPALNDRLCRTGLAELTDPGPPRPPAARRRPRLPGRHRRPDQTSRPRRLTIAGIQPAKLTRKHET